jgi:hypothetical protein
MIDPSLRRGERTRNAHQTKDSKRIFGVNFRINESSCRASVVKYLRQV